MKYLFLFLSIVFIQSCNSTNSESELVKKNPSEAKLDSLHSGFNEIELTKEFIQLNKDTITIVTFGHVYSILNHDDIFDSMIEQINSQSPDYVWILGDIVFNNSDEEWAYLQEKYKGINARRFHAGGNHDMNYHYERYFGITDNQWEAESRFLKNVGYRYLTLEDDFSNYMLINMNDSLDRIEQYLDKMTPLLNPDKPSILFTHHSVWHKTISDPGDTKTWSCKSFPPDSLLPKVEEFEYLIHGDWADAYFKWVYSYQGVDHNVIAVGNSREGFPLYITTIKITEDSLWSYPTFVNIPDTASWKIKNP